MKSSAAKHSVIIAGHYTSVYLKDEFWNGLREIAKGRHETVSHLLAPSTRIGNKAICHPPFASLSLAFIAIATTEHKRSWLRRSR